MTKNDGNDGNDGDDGKDGVPPHFDNPDGSELSDGASDTVFHPQSERSSVTTHSRDNSGTVAIDVESIITDNDLTTADEVEITKKLNTCYDLTIGLRAGTTNHEDRVRRKHQFKNVFNRLFPQLPDDRVDMAFTGFYSFQATREELVYEFLALFIQLYFVEPRNAAAAAAAIAIQSNSQESPEIAHVLEEGRTDYTTPTGNTGFQGVTSGLSSLVLTVDSNNKEQGQSTQELKDMIASQSKKIEELGEKMAGVLLTLKQTEVEAAKNKTEAEENRLKYVEEQGKAEQLRLDMAESLAAIDSRLAEQEARQEKRFEEQERRHAEEKSANLVLHTQTRETAVQEAVAQARIEAAENGDANIAAAIAVEQAQNLEKEIKHMAEIAKLKNVVDVSLQ